MQHDERWDALLAEYLDGSVTLPVRRRVEAHLATCAACAEAVVFARAGRDALAGPAQPVPLSQRRPETTSSADDFLAAVLQRAGRAAASGGTDAPEVTPVPAGWRGRVTAAAKALADREQAEPVLWFLVALPAFPAILAPSGATLAFGAAALALGAILEYILTREVSPS